MVKLIVNPSEALGGDDLKLWKPNKSNRAELIRWLEHHIEGYFDDKYSLDDFKLSRIDFTANLDVGKENVKAYIKIMHKLGKAKGYSIKFKPDYEGSEIDKELSFDLAGNTNDLEFSIYDKEAQLKNCEKNNKAKKAEGILRVEVRLRKRKAIKRILGDFADGDCFSTSQEIDILAKESEKIFIVNTAQIIPFGDHYRLRKAEEIVKASDYNKRPKEKMLRLLRLVPEKKSLYNAIKELNTRNIDELMLLFAKLDVSPITISKREDADHLKSLYNYLPVTLKIITANDEP
jgi:hypothetical protein